MSSILDKIENDFKDGSVADVQEAPVQEIPVQEAPVQGKSYVSEKVLELNSYLNKYPDKDISDYQILKQSSSDLSDLDILRLYYSDKEGIKGDDLSSKLSKYSDLDLDIDEFDEDYDDKIDIINGYKDDVNSAREWRDGYVSEVLASLDKSNEFVEMNAEASTKARENYLSVLYSSIPEYKSESITIDGETFDFIPDEEYISRLRQIAENPDILYSSFQEESGVLKDTKGWFDMLSWADPVLREKKNSFINKQTTLRDRVAQDNMRRNITTNSSQGVSGSRDLDDEFKAFLTDKARSKF